MRSIGWIFLLCLAHRPLAAQYFFTGEVKDAHGDKLQNGSILVQSTGTYFKTGFHGEFEIVSMRSEDSLIFLFDGYEPYVTPVNATSFLQITLKKPSFSKTPNTNHIKAVYRAISVCDPVIVPGNDYTGSPDENAFVDSSSGVSFTANNDRGSCGIVRRFLNMGLPVPPEAVQIEEMLNYFNFYHEYPDDEDPFHCSSTLLSCPWNEAHQLLYMDIRARKVDIENVPAANLVLLIDVSGSMDLPNKLPMIKSGIRLLIENLRNIDTVSLITFGDGVRVMLKGLPGSAKGRMIRAIQELEPEGSTPCEEGLQAAYEIARSQYIPGGNNRIVLITDGDIGEEPTMEKELETRAEEQGPDGISLHCIGVGMNGTAANGASPNGTGANNDSSSQLPLLARISHGEFAVANDEPATERLLARQLAPASLAVADGVFITTDFNPSLVRQYRLIGYDNKKNIRDDTIFRLERNPVSSCHSMFALFELMPKKDTTGCDTIAGVKISYHLPGQKADQLMSYYCHGKVIPFDKAEAALKKSVCVAMLGMKLRESVYVSQISWADLERMAKKNFTIKDYMDREYLTLIAKAKKIYAQAPSPSSK